MLDPIWISCFIIIGIALLLLSIVAIVSYFQKQKKNQNYSETHEHGSIVQLDSDSGQQVPERKISDNGGEGSNLAGEKIEYSPKFSNENGHLDFLLSRNQQSHGMEAGSVQRPVFVTPKPPTTSQRVAQPRTSKIIFIPKASKHKNSKAQTKVFTVDDQHIKKLFETLKKKKRSLKKTIDFLTGNFSGMK